MHFSGARLAGLFSLYAAVLAASIAACGGATQAPSPPDAAAPDSATLPDAGVTRDGSVTSDAVSNPDAPFGALVPGCPAAAPANGAPCSTNPNPNLECEYGNDWDIRCNHLFVCMTLGSSTQGSWADIGIITEPPIGPAHCPTPTGLAPGCPATHALATGQCTAHEAACAFAEGMCVCAQHDPAGSLDGGPGPYEWTCATPDPRCPAVRPRSGSACTQEGLTCDYTICADYGGSFYCTAEGVWNAESLMDDCWYL
jgi:hypothetical protein